MPNPLIRKLETAEDFTDDDRSLVELLCSRPRKVAAGQHIIHHGDKPSDVHLVLDGFVMRYKLMPQGKRQILALLLPGDFCDLHVAILGEMDHSLATLTPCTIVDISAATIRDLSRHHPRIIRAFWWATLVDEGTLREWLASVGQREAIRRMAHIFCEMLVRLQVTGFADGNSYAFPLTQTDLGDLLGLTNVHVNRTLQSLRDAGLVVIEKRKVTIPDVDRLKSFCSFDPAYLHLNTRLAEASVGAEQAF